MIPVLYSETERDYGHGGIGVLTDTMNYLITEEANGEFELYLEYPVQGSMFTELKNNRLIKAKPNDLDDDHVFRIYEVVKDLERQTVYIYATSISNDLGNNMVSSLKITSKTAQEALNMLKANLIEPTHFNFVSDIATRSSTEWEFRNPLNCIVGEDGSLVKYWGGEVKRTNDTVYLYARRGRDNVAVLREGKNLEGLEMTISTKGIVTKILPYMTRYDEATGEERLIVGNIVTSPLVNNYPVKSIKAVDYTLYDDVETAAELNTLAGGYFTYQNPGVDKPKVSIDIDIMQLADSPLYSQYSKLESLGLFDSVSVYIPRFDVSVIVKVNRIEYNGLLERAEKIQCGDPVGNIFDDVKAGYTNMIIDTEAKITNIVQRAANGVSSIFRGTSEPTNGFKTGDLWYKPIGEFEIEMYQWNGMEWELILSTKELNMYRPLIESAIEAAEQAKADAEQAYSDSVAEAERLVTAQTEAFDAEMVLRQGEIQDAKNQADLAVGKATANAEAIFGKLDLATYEANKTAVETELGKKLATATYTAQKQTQDALIAGKVALTTYNAKMTSLDTAINGTSLRVDELEDGFALTATKTEVDSLKTRMNTAELSITATSNQLALKASQTDLNAATGRLTTAEGRITANATAIELRATKTDVNALTGRVTTAEGTITAQAGQIALRATTATVNALTGRVNTAEASIVTQAGKIDLAATKSELTTAINGIQVGGRNLLISGTVNRLSTRMTHKSTKKLKGNGDYYFDFSASLEPGKVYTLSNTSIVNSSTTYVNSLSVILYNVTGGTIRQTIGSLMSGGNLTFTSSVNTAPTDRIFFYVSQVPFVDFEIDELKLEKGNKATDWTPAPEDVDVSVATVQANLTVEAGKITALTTRVSGSETNISTVTQTVSGINTTISTLRTDVNGKATIISLNEVKSTADGNKTTITNHSGRLTTVETNVNGLQTTVADKADKSQITQLTTSISTKVESAAYNTKMSQIDSAINLRVVQGDVTAAILADKKIKDTRTTNQLPSWYFTNYPSQRVEEFKNRTAIGVSGSAIYVKLVTDVPWSDPSGGVIVQTAYSSDGVYNRSGNAAGTAWGVWVKQTDSANVLAQVNLSTEGVLIQGKRIQLDGDVTMTAAYVTKLNTQTITAVNANITSIRSQVLVTDSVTSTHIKAENALIDGIFGTTALITRLTSKTAFINNVKAIEISADKVTTGTLNAANVSIINLNASNITTGRLNGLELYGGHINGGRITSSGTVGELAINSASLTVHNDKVVNGQIQRAVVALSNTQQDFPGLRIWHGVVNSSGITTESFGSTNITPEDGIQTTKPIRVGDMALEGYANSIKTYSSGMVYVVNSFNDRWDLGVRYLNASSRIQAGNISIVGSDLVHMGNSTINFMRTDGQRTNIAANMIESTGMRISAGSTLYLLNSDMMYIANTHDDLRDLRVRHLSARDRVTGGNLSLYNNDIVHNGNADIHFTGANGTRMNIHAARISSGNQVMSTGNTYYALNGNMLYFADRNDQRIDIGVRTVSQSSEYRLKENFEMIGDYDALHEILKTDVVKYRFKGDDEPRLGLIIGGGYQTSGLFVAKDGRSKKDSDIIGALMLSVKYLYNTQQSTVATDILRINTFVSQHDIEIDNLQKENEALRQRIELLEEKIV